MHVLKQAGCLSRQFMDSPPGALIVWVLFSAFWMPAPTSAPGENAPP